MLSFRNKMQSAIEKGSSLPTWSKAIIFAFIPIVACFFFAALQGKALWELDATASAWNDEVFYFKQLEGMIAYGMPLGYFGYNGSSAAVGSLGAWSIFLLLPYVPFVALVGCAKNALMYNNLLFLFLSSLIFFFLVRPNLRQSIILGLIYFASPFVLRYSVSFMAEPLFFCGAIILAGLVINLSKRDSPGILLWVFYALVLYLSLCRPYFFAFSLFGILFQFKHSWWKAILTFLSVMVVFVLVYIKAVVPMQAPYFFPLVDASVFAPLKQGNVLGCITLIFQKIFNSLRSLKIFLLQLFSADASTSNQAVGGIYAAFLFCVLYLLLWLISAIRKKHKAVYADTVFWIVVISLLVAAAILLAILLFYSPQVGCRHTIAISLFLILIISMLLPQHSTKYEKGFFCIFILAYAAAQWVCIGDSYSFTLPTAEDEFSTRPIVSDAELLSHSFEVSPTLDPWSNTVYFDFSNVSSSYLFYLPAGSGIQIVTHDFLVSDPDTIPARYILISGDEASKAFFNDSGWEPIIEATEYVLLQRQSE